MKRLTSYTLLLCLLLLFAAPASAATLTASWQANPAADGVTSYTLYWGTSAGAHPNKVAAGNVLTYQLTGLPPLTKVFAILTASNPGGESASSAEVSATTLPDPPGAAQAPSLVATPVSGAGK